jgi:ribosomal protein S18 acetylase RimI-like enzyme
MLTGNNIPDAKRLRLIPSTDIVLLSRLYQELLEDESFDIPRTADELRDSMAGHLSAGETAFLFVADDEVVGYSLIKGKCSPPYIHHFFICRNARRHGYGKEAFYALLEALKTDCIDLDVLVWNERGQAFWSSLGFQPRSVIMRYQANNGHG